LLEAQLALHRCCYLQLTLQLLYLRNEHLQHRPASKSCEHLKSCENHIGALGKSPTVNGFGVA
jgi:hypothetical protein